MQSFLNDMGYTCTVTNLDQLRKIGERAGLLQAGDFKSLTKTCTRAEAAVIAVRSTREWEDYRARYRSFQGDIKDYTQIPERYQDAVLRLYSRSCIELDSNGNFRPSAAADKNFVKNLKNLALYPDQRTPKTVSNIQYVSAESWMRCDSLSEQFSANRATLKVSTDSVDGNGSVEMVLTQKSPSLFITFETPQDLSDYTGIEISFKNVKGTIQSSVMYVIPANKVGQADYYFARTADDAQGALYQNGTSMPMSQKWQTRQWLFTHLQSPWGLGIQVDDENERKSILSEVSKLRIDFSTGDYSGNQDLLIDQIRFFKAETDGLNDPVYTNIKKDDAKYKEYSNAMTAAGKLSGKKAAAAYLSILETYSPADEKAQEKLTALYKSMSNADKTALKEAIQALYNRYLYEDREKAQAFSAYHMLLTDIWTAGIGAQGQIYSVNAFNDKSRTSGKSAVEESAALAMDIGVDTIKFNLGKSDQNNTSLLSDDVVGWAKEKSFKAVFEMPFKNYIMWVHETGNAWSMAGYGNGIKADNTYRQIYDLTEYLLKTYNNTGKAFYLGNWEGDHVLGTTFAGPSKTNGLIEWYKVRQQAIDDAMKATPHKNVYVYGYLELNTWNGSAYGYHTMSNTVLQYAPVDFVSYSAYATANYAANANEVNQEYMDHTIEVILNHYESRTAPKDFAGKRVFIGEYGTNSLQAIKNGLTQPLKSFSKWGTPFVLVWQLYDGTYNWGLYDENKETGYGYDLMKRVNKEIRTYIAQYQKEHNGQYPPMKDVSYKLNTLI